jgi:hypothetical protein
VYSLSSPVKMDVRVNFMPGACQNQVARRVSKTTNLFTYAVGLHEAHACFYVGPLAPVARHGRASV